MKFKVFIVFVFFVCCLLPGISFAQNKVVVIPLMSDSDNKIPTVTSAGGRVWMDRNLGALQVAERADDYRAYGWLYQWGRLADGHETGHGPITTTLSAGNVPGHDNFITVTESPYDWHSSQNDNLWQGVSGINNPCPGGFRLPTLTEWETERASWSSDDAKGAFASPLKLVLAGFRDHSDGTVRSVGIQGHYWSSTVYIDRAYRLFISNAQNYIGNNYRALGANVRCIKD
jgi:uncharacterized protein (TIGR02145 family)